MPHYRIYADFNGVQHSVATPGMSALYLHYFGSLQDISRQQVQLKEGMTVDVYSDSDEKLDLEVTGTVRFDVAGAMWFVEFNDANVHEVPTREGPANPPFPCWSCQADISEVISSSGLNPTTKCSRCGCRIHQPLDAPISN